MESWRRYLELRLKAKTGLSSAVITSAVLALLCAVLTFGFVLVTAFVWLAEKYDPLMAALVLCGLFLLLTIIALLACVWAHNSVIKGARRELAARTTAPWLEPRLIASALQASRAVGGQRLLAIAAVALLAAGIGMQWRRHERLAATDGDGHAPLSDPT
jgi:hypothetical protein